MSPLAKCLGAGLTSKRRHGSRNESGFTLLEMMIALAVLATALMWLIEATTRAIIAENTAKMLTTATFLSRREWVELEDEVATLGFTDESFASEKCDAVAEAGFKRFTACHYLEKITLPGTGAVQDLMTKAQQGGLSSSDGNSPLMGLMGMGAPGAGGGTGNQQQSMSMFGQQFGMVKDILEQGIRKAHVTIKWTERGEPKSLEVTEYLVDPRKVDQAFQIQVK